jgi:SHS2 domain-containing protein
MPPRDMSPNQPFKEFDHSGDIGIEARGGSKTELIEHLSLGLFSLMCRSRVETDVERRIAASSESEEGLIVAWLSEIISAADVHGEIYGMVRVDKLEPDRLEGVIGGERYDPDKHELRFEVKAATYHGLKVERSGGRYGARVIFDL